MNDLKLIELFKLAKSNTNRLSSYELFIQSQFGGRLSPHIQEALNKSKSLHQFLMRVSL